ncbi:expressed unknown protein [Seminavis robusta]|uniref:Uncharacterized protein n=1 Tax=Seminavis robusta TaxID=568900 RepID=A0A9N8EFH8_9STRA|nr:expressed unknown protein [Seminavis robusta]|eukprot:Sro1077_g238630.1 n/a (303) ;mRNA; r:22992-23900
MPRSGRLQEEQPQVIFPEEVSDEEEPHDEPHQEPQKRVSSLRQSNQPTAHSGTNQSQEYYGDQEDFDEEDGSYDEEFGGQQPEVRSDPELVGEYYDDDDDDECWEQEEGYEDDDDEMLLSTDGDGQATMRKSTPNDSTRSSNYNGSNRESTRSYHPHVFDQDDDEFSPKGFDDEDEEWEDGPSGEFSEPSAEPLLHNEQRQQQQQPTMDVEQGETSSDNSAWEESYHMDEAQQQQPAEDTWQDPAVAQNGEPQLEKARDVNAVTTSKSGGSNAPIFLIAGVLFLTISLICSILAIVFRDAKA